MDKLSLWSSLGVIRRNVSAILTNKETLVYRKDQVCKPKGKRTTGLPMFIKTKECRLFVI